MLQPGVWCRVRGSGVMQQPRDCSRGYFLGKRVGRTSQPRPATSRLLPPLPTACPNKSSWGNLLNPTPHTPHPTPYTIHDTQHTIHPAPYALHTTPPKPATRELRLTVYYEGFEGHPRDCSHHCRLHAQTSRLGVTSDTRNTGLTVDGV